MQLTNKQEYFLEQCRQGKSIYLSGKAGTGKSTIVKIAIEELSKNKRVIAIAPTGIAANNIGGQTIHSMFNLNPYGILDYEALNFLKGEKRVMLSKVDTIFIDEVSMVRPDILDAIDLTLKKNGCKKLSQMQVVYIGDLKQLPPILKDNDRAILYQSYDGDFFYHSKFYQKHKPLEIELDEVVRQSDEEFINNLNIVRDGGKSEYFKKFLTKEKKGIILAAYNSTVQMYNEEGLKSINQPLMEFEAQVEGNVKAEDFNLERVVRVKNGCKIMYLTNSKDNELYNGALGIFVSHNDCYYIRIGNIDYPLNKIRNAKKEYVYNKITDSLELTEKGSIEQYPIKLAYAISIHKSQGMTFNEVTIDLSKPCFEKGQLYVALSRVKTPAGLNIIVNR
jgi:ATP-dependent exoDNAse (exonuclease V) alpha subunit